MTDDEPEIFNPTDTARSAFKALMGGVTDQVMDGFFDMWEAEDDPRKAGSMVAHAYISNAAKVAVFGAECAGKEPRKDLWLKACEEAYDAATKDVGAAVAGWRASNPETQS